MHTISLFSQDEKDADLLQTFRSYFQAIERKDHAQTLEFIYPRLFQHYPKELMLKAMEDMDADTSVRIAMEDAVAGRIFGHMTIGGVHYAQMEYSFLMIMTLLPDGSEADEEGATAFSAFDFTHSVLQGVYGKENVSSDKAQSQIFVRAHNTLYAIRDPEYPGWKFLEKKESLQPLLEKLLPKKIWKNN